MSRSPLIRLQTYPEQARLLDSSAFWTISGADLVLFGGRDGERAISTKPRVAAAREEKARDGARRTHVRRSPLGSR